MGAIPLAKGVAFRVCAPHAEGVAVVGTFNDFDAARDPAGNGPAAGAVSGALRRGGPARNGVAWIGYIPPPIKVRIWIHTP